MKFQLSRSTVGKILGKILPVFIAGTLIITSYSVENVSAYYTSGALGKSLNVAAGFSVNRNYLAYKGTACRSGLELESFAGVTIHETSNWSAGSNARMHAFYLRDGGANSEVSWHYSVDSSSAYQSIPESEKAWHAGDKTAGTGNARTIAIEICDYSNDSNFDQAMANAEWLAADILFRHGVYSAGGYLFQHHDFSSYGKNCPITIRDTNRWQEFTNKTQMFLDQMISAMGSYTLNDNGGDLTFSGSLPSSYSASRVDIYKDDNTAVGTTPVNNNSILYTVDASYFTIGWHTLNFAAIHGDGSVSWTSKTFLVGPAAQIGLNSPTMNTTYSADITVTGWAVSHAAISKVNIYADDNQLLGTVTNFTQRSDIDTAVNSAGKYKDALNSGYTYIIGAGTLLNGAHEIRAEAISYDGTKQSIITMITVGLNFPSGAAVTYQSHVQNIGWQAYVKNGLISGTTGESKRMEALQINLENISGGIEYKAHVQDIGWMNWVSDGSLSGTIGQSKRLEAIQIRLTGAAAEEYDIYYRVHAQNIGWMAWAKNGEAAGTAGYSYRLEALQIVLVKKGGTAPGSAAQPYRDFNVKDTTAETSGTVNTDPTVSYQTHIQDIGWQNPMTNGVVSGTSGLSKRMEGVRIKLENIDGGIEYKSHVQDIGWQEWVNNDVLSGTTGQSKRIEAIQIRLTGAAVAIYDVYYRVHVQNIGWMDWAKNGEPAGTAGYSYRMEAVQVVLVLKGAAAPGAVTRSYTQASL